MHLHTLVGSLSLLRPLDLPRLPKPRLKSHRSGGFGSLNRTGSYPVDWGMKCLVSLSVQDLEFRLQGSVAQPATEYLMLQAHHHENVGDGVQYARTNYTAPSPLPQTPHPVASTLSPQTPQESWAEALCPAKLLAPCTLNCEWLALTLRCWRSSGPWQGQPHPFPAGGGGQAVGFRVWAVSFSNSTWLRTRDGRPLACG